MTTASAGGVFLRLQKQFAPAGRRWKILKIDTKMMPKEVDE